MFINARTNHVFPIDIELCPSLGLVSAFFELIDREKKGLVRLISNSNPDVYVIPIFEVKAKVELRSNKSELRRLFKSGHYFDQEFCIKYCF
jgi:hypothetical protein